MTFHLALLNRQWSGRRGRDQPFLADLSCDAASGGTSISWDPKGVQSLPFCAEFSKEIYGGRLLAVGDEEGLVSVIDTAAQLPKVLSQATPSAQWVGHRNAIFALQWYKGDERLVTASGDKTLALWDTSSATCIGQCFGHAGSVKTVCASSKSSNLLASGGRDGAVMIWDARCLRQLTKGGNNCLGNTPVSIIRDGHKPADIKTKRRSASHRVVAQEANPSVTAVLLLAEDNVLATAGAANEIVKLWDMRKLTKPAAQLIPERLRKPSARLCSMAPPGEPSAWRHRGVTSLALDETGSRLLVSVASNTHYLYDALRPHLPPAARYTGHEASSFYVKAAFSPDGSHFVSGSSDKNAYIWPVDQPEVSPLVLKGHDDEVTGVAWCRTDGTQLATCGDDAAVRLWRVHRRDQGPRCSRKQQGDSDWQLQTRFKCRCPSPQDASPAADRRSLLHTCGQEQGQENVAAVGRSSAATTTPARSPFAPVQLQIRTPPVHGGAAPLPHSSGRLAQQPITAYFRSPAPQSVKHTIGSMQDARRQDPKPGGSLQCVPLHKLCEPSPPTAATATLEMGAAVRAPGSSPAAAAAVPQTLQVNSSPGAGDQQRAAQADAAECTVSLADHPAQPGPADVDQRALMPAVPGSRVGTPLSSANAANLVACHVSRVAAGDADMKHNAGERKRKYEQENVVNNTPCAKDRVPSGRSTGTVIMNVL